MCYAADVQRIGGNWGMVLETTVAITFGNTAVQPGVYYVGAKISDAGAISLQDAAMTTMVGDAANHSRKGSGLGPSRMGDEGFTRFLRRQALIRQTGAPVTMEAFREGPPA